MACKHGPLFVALLLLGNALHSARGHTGAERPGECPKPVNMMLELCSEFCTFDTDCPEGKKCCKTGCNGLSCKYPNGKPGKCPVVEEKDGEPCADESPCLSDSSCDGSLKCCKSSCGRYFCQNPEVTTTTESSVQLEDTTKVPDGASSTHESTVPASNMTTVDEEKGN